MRLQIQNDKEYIKELENYIEILEHEEDRLREKLLNKDKEIERLNNIIKEVREYIENGQVFDISLDREFAVFDRKKLLEILDKVD